MERDIALARSIARAFRRHVVEECVPRIRRCVGLLSAVQVWEKPSPHCNSIGVLLLHLEGNVRQWILAGLGDEPDLRDRPSEFAATAATTDATPAELVERLADTARRAAELVDGLTPARLLATHTFQGRFTGDGVGGVLHVLEHFSGHAGQIYAWTKQLLGVDLRFYDL